MDTKVQKFSYNMMVRILAFMLCVMLFTTVFISGLITIIGIEKSGRSFAFDEIFGTQNYLESSDLQEEFQHQASRLIQVIEYYKSESYIKEGKLLDKNDGTLLSAISNLYYNGNCYYGERKITANQLQISYDVAQKEGENIPEIVINTVHYPIEDNDNNIQSSGNMSYEEAYNYAYEYVTYNADIQNNQHIRKAFMTANNEQISEIKTILIKDQLRSFNNLKDQLNSQQGMTYFVTDGSNSYTNIKLLHQAEVGIAAEEIAPQIAEVGIAAEEIAPQIAEVGIAAEEIASNSTVGKVVAPDIEEFEKNPAYMFYKDGKLVKVPQSRENANSWVRDIDNSIENELFTAYNDDLKVYLAFSQEYIDTKQAVYQYTSEIINLFPLILGCAIGCLILFLYLMITTGRKDEEGKCKLYVLDKIWTEVQFAGIIAALGMGIGIGGFILYNWEYSKSISVMEIIILAIICLVITSIGLWFALSCIRLLKSRNFIKKSLIYKLWKLTIYNWCVKILDSIKAIYSGSNLMKKIVIFTLGICLLSATIFLAPIVFLAIIVFAPKWVRKFEKIKNGVEEVKNGNLTYKISVEGNSELDKLAQSINEISEASNIAVKNELKNQRMKTELISNVSHDIKTPLTSMVSYIDLLKTEGLDSENADEYLRILDEKTNRLRLLTEDLFEAAKASSGVMPVHFEKVELLSLINQGLGEMDQKIQASGLDFIVNADEDKYYVKADGQLLWRVVENLLGNVLKYALENSRVYIDIMERRPKKESITNLVTLEVKNISKNPLNISAEGLMERFKRGDESRTTEGSGLGLAIAKDLVKIQNGWFQLYIDGDLFKAQVMLNKYEDEQPE